MGSGTVFDSLPFHIIHQVVSYIVKDPDDLDDMTADILGCRLYLGLLHACAAWRQAALSIIFSRCEARIGRSSSFYYTGITNMSSLANKIHPRYNCFVKTLDLSLDYQSILEGEDNFHKSKYSWLAFPQSRLLNLTLFRGCHSELPTQRPDIWLAGFERILDQLAPAITHVNLNIPIGSLPSEKCLSNQFVKQVLEFVCKNKKSVQVCHNMPKPMATFEHLLPENSLTFLETTWNDHNHQKVAQAIHTNAKSLAKLHLRFNSAAGSKYFLTKDGKECLVFPNLTVISLSRVCHEEIKMISPVSKLIPFPHLQVAEIGFKYPFADDILFRGNNKVLDTVNLVLDCKVINILLFDRWVNGRKPNLRSMVLFEAVSQINQYCSKSMYQQFFDKIFSSVRYFYSHSQHITDSLVQSLIPHRHYDNLQILSLINCTITLTQFLKLLDAFPGLFKIICSAPGYDGVFADKNIKEIFSKVKGILGEFRPCIGYWMISDPTVLPVDQIVELIILVTGLCPNLREINFGLRVEERVLCIYTKLCHSFQLIRYSDIVPAIESFTLSYEKSKPSIIVTKKSIELKE